MEISKNADIKDFAFWLLKKEKIEIEQDEKALDVYFDENTEKNNYAYKSSEAAFLLWRLGKFIRYYTKPILLENGFFGSFPYKKSGGFVSWP